VTRGQMQRLESIFQCPGEKPTGESCKGMKGLIYKAGDDMASRDGSPSVIDAAIISAAARRTLRNGRIWHGSHLRRSARRKGIRSLLQQTPDEEREADKTLTEIAKTINVQARAA